MPDNLSKSKPWPEIPEIPPQVQNAAERGKLVLFVGAGVSRLAGARSWEDAANMAMAQLVSQEIIPYGAAELLKGEHPKKKLSIAIDISIAENKPLKLDEIFTAPGRFKPDAQIFHDLYSINTPIVTTNYDNGLEVQTKKEENFLGAQSKANSARSHISPRESQSVYYHRNDLTINRLNEPGAVIHLHGSLSDQNNMIISTRQYLEHYQSEMVQTFLSSLFDNYTVLFLGYGLEEEEILEYVINKNQKRRCVGSNAADHYWLYHGLTYQEARIYHLSNYYRKHCNVEIIPFDIDKLGHSQLSKVIDFWAKILGQIVRPPQFLDEVSLIDDVL